MTHSEREQCPWSILGLPRTATAKQIQDAYRKLAFKWHPDLNQGSNNCQQRFQQITDAFEKVKKEHELMSRRSRSGVRQHQSKGSFSTFRYRRANESQFRSGYQEPPNVDRAARGTHRDSLHTMRSRMRAFESLGTGIGVLGAVAIVGLSMLGTEYVWRTSNRGKSFEDLMRQRSRRIEDDRHRRKNVRRDDDGCT